MKLSHFPCNDLSIMHGLNIEEYEELVKSKTKLQEFKMATGFTDKLDQCGFFMRQYKAFRCLREHRRIHHGEKGAEKKTKANNKQLPKPKDKNAERKRVSLDIILYIIMYV